MKFHGKSAVVTGAASGLGRATARALADLGVRVIALDRVEPTDPVKASGSGTVEHRLLDVADPRAVDELFTGLAAEIGCVNICVNAAGVATAAKVLSPSRPMTRELFSQIIEVNLVGAYDVMRHCAELMVEAEPQGEDGERGVIINVSSGAAFQGQKGQVAYSASKAALIGMMLPAARDLAPHGIRVLTIAPGLFATGMSAGLPPQTVRDLEDSMVFPNRLGRPEEFAALVCDLVGNPYLNAETIGIDAGVRMT